MLCAFPVQALRQRDHTGFTGKLVLKEKDDEGNIPKQ